MIAVNNYEDFGYQSNGYGDDFGYYGDGFGGGGNVLTSTLIDGGGGGGNSGGGNTTTIATTPANKLFQITSNIVGAQIYINGINTYKVTSQNLTFTKEELLTSDKVITLQKEGYINNEKYVVSLENPNGATIIKPPMLTIGDITETLGLSSTVIRVKYYVNDLEVIGSITQNLSFNLKQTLVEVTPTLYNFNVNVNGSGNSVRVVKNGKVEFFPDNGSTPYSDLIGTTFNIESANPSLYRITQIQVNS